MESVKAAWADPYRRTLIIGAAVLLVLVNLPFVLSALQDRKKEALQPETWRAWESRTSYTPFAAVLAGRARLGGFGLHTLLGGLVIWLAATWAHIPAAGMAAGVWRWLR